MLLTTTTRETTDDPTQRDLTVKVDPKIGGSMLRKAILTPSLFPSQNLVQVVEKE